MSKKKQSHFRFENWLNWSLVISMVSFLQITELNFFFLLPFYYVLKETVRQKDQSIRKYEQEIDSLQFRNDQVTQFDPFVLLITNFYVSWVIKAVLSSSPFFWSSKLVNFVWDWNQNVVLKHLYVVPLLKLSKRVAVLQEELDEYDGRNRRGKVDITVFIYLFYYSHSLKISASHHSISIRWRHLMGFHLHLWCFWSCIIL